MHALARTIITAAALTAGAGTASADIDFHIGIGSSFGFCGSGIGIYSGISLGHHWGWHRPYRHWSSCGPSWGYSDWGYNGWHRPSWGHSGYYRHDEPRRRHRRSSDWCVTEAPSPAAITVASTHDRTVNRTLAVTDTTPATDRLADAWKLLEQGEANRAQGFFALAAAKEPGDAVAKLGFALSCAMMGDETRAEWSARRALDTDEGELAALELASSASIVLADLMDIWAQDPDLVVRLEKAMPGVITLPTTEAAGG